MPVGSTPIFSLRTAGPCCVITNAAVNGFDTDWIENL